MTRTSSPDSLLGQLREATRDVHARLDSGSYATRLTQGTLPRPWLINALEVEHTYFAWIEAQLQQTQHPAVRAAAVESTPRASAIRADLDAIRQREGDNNAPLVVDLDAWVESLDACAERASESLLGMLYTLEGSALGGLFIRRRLAAIFPDEQHAMTRFAPPDRTVAQWRAFCSVLDRVELTQVQRDAVLVGAQLVFDGFEQLFEQIAERAPG